LRFTARSTEAAAGRFGTPGTRTPLGQKIETAEKTGDLSIPGVVAPASVRYGFCSDP
jgi:hypothetical protein